MRRPPPEGLGLGLPASQDEVVEPCFIGAPYLLSSARGIHRASTLFIIIQLPDNIGDIRVVQRSTNSSHHPPGLPCRVDFDTDFMVLVAEGNELRHGLALLHANLLIHTLQGESMRKRQA